MARYRHTHGIGAPNSSVSKLTVEEEKALMDIPSFAARVSGTTVEKTNSKYTLSRDLHITHPSYSYVIFVPYTTSPIITNPLLWGVSCSS